MSKETNMTDLDPQDLSALLPAIWRLQGDYARFVDGREPEAWSQLFGESGTLAVGTREITGSDALAEFAAQSTAGVHVQGVPTVARQADGRIRSTSSFVFVNAATQALIAGEYRDDIEETGDGLVFARREVEVRARG
jgi:hypothetical protein